MARKTIFISDLTGTEINERDALDVNAPEVDDLASKGTKQARRGRKPKADA
jgi:hypothetical protein